MIDHKEYWFRFMFRFIVQPLVIVAIAVVLSFFTPYAIYVFRGMLIGSLTVSLMFCLPDTLDYFDFLRYRHRCKKFNSKTSR